MSRFSRNKNLEIATAKNAQLYKARNFAKTKTLICKTQNANLKHNLFLENRPKDLLQVLANGMRYLRGGGDGEAVQPEKGLGVGNCLGCAHAAEGGSPQRQVHALLGVLLLCKTHCLKKIPPLTCLDFTLNSIFGNYQKDTFKKIRHRNCEEMILK